MLLQRITYNAVLDSFAKVGDVVSGLAWLISLGQCLVVLSSQSPYHRVSSGITKEGAVRWQTLIQDANLQPTELAPQLTDSCSVPVKLANVMQVSFGADM
jgi:hypothetical protein